MAQSVESALLFAVSLGLWRAASKTSDPTQKDSVNLGCLLLLDVHTDSKASSNAATMLDEDVYDTTMLGRIKEQGRRNALSAEDSAMIIAWLGSELSGER